MSNSNINALWKTLTSLSGIDALLLGFLLLCAAGGALVAIYVGIRAVVDSRRERRADRMQHAGRGGERPV
jgi:hypothetical protein